MSGLNNSAHWGQRSKDKRAPRGQGECFNGRSNPHNNDTCSCSLQCLLQLIPRHRIPPKHGTHVRKYSIFHLYLANTEANRNRVYSPQTKYPKKVQLEIKADTKHEISNPSVSHVCSSSKISITLTVCTSTGARRHQDAPTITSGNKNKNNKKKAIYLLSETHIVRLKKIWV